MSPTATPTTPTTPPATAPTGSAGSRASAAVVFVAVVVLASGVLAQLVGPFIRRDDWPFLLPAGTPGAADPILKVEGEGRWLSYAWWLVVGQHGTPTTAVVVFFAAYVLFVVGLWRLFRVTGRVTGVLLGAALLVSPLWIRLIYWPGTLSACAVVAAAGVWTLPWAARRRRGLAAWVVVVAVLSVLTYPPVGGLLLIAAAVHLRDRPWKDLLFLVGGFLVGFATGIVVVSVANLVAFGNFGPEIAAWRNPNQLGSSGDLLVNARRYLRQLLGIRRTLGPAGVVGLVSAVLALVDPRVRPVLLKVFLAVAVVAGLECAQTLVTGVRTNVRGSLWAWLAVVLPGALLLAGSTWSRRAGQASLLVLAVLGLFAWRSDIGVHQATKRGYDEIVASAVQSTGSDPAREVVFFQDPAERRTARGQITAGTLRMMLFEEAGVVVRWCRASECTRLASRADQGPVHDLGSVTGVVVPSPPAVL